MLRSATTPLRLRTLRRAYDARMSPQCMDAAHPEASGATARAAPPGVTQRAWRHEAGRTPISQVKTRTPPPTSAHPLVLLQRSPIRAMTLERRLVAWTPRRARASVRRLAVRTPPTRATPWETSRERRPTALAPRRSEGRLVAWTPLSAATRERRLVVLAPPRAGCRAWPSSWPPWCDLAGPSAAPEVASHGKQPDKHR